MSKIAFAALVLCALTVTNGAQAAPGVVYPTGVYPTDVQNVQAAVDLGGTVLLKARNAEGAATAFNFGPPVEGPGFVTLHRDVQLIGEQVGSSSATIEGGHTPVRGSGSNVFKAGVRGVAFVGQLYGALSFRSSTIEVEIIGNQVLDVVGETLPDGTTTAQAISVGFSGGAINYNIIENVDAEFGVGIEQFRAAGPVEIVGNRVTGTNNIAIESTANSGAVTITDNSVHPGPELYPSGSLGVGIEINGTGSYYVARNQVSIESFFGVGIVAFGTEAFEFGAVNGAVIEKNRIELVGDVTGGVVLNGLVSDTYIGQNSIAGTTFIAFGLIGQNPALGPSDLGSNTIVGNNIGRLLSGFADVALDFDAHDTVVKGNGGTVDDNGTNNRISGFTKGGEPGTGRQVSEAVRRRSQAAQLGSGQSFTGP